jgi:SAM-dependent methyltransferase
MIKRCSGLLEFQLLEREAVAHGADRILDAGCGEGRVALTLAARHPHRSVEGLEVSATNARIARRLNRFSNLAFHEGLIEEADRFFRPDSFDLAYSLGVLEHVWDIDETVTAILKLLRPGGRFCLAVPMNELRAVGPLHDFTPAGMACRVRVFTEGDLRERFGRYDDFTLVKIPGKWRPGRYPDPIVPVEFGSYLVAFSKT